MSTIKFPSDEVVRAKVQEAIDQINKYHKVPLNNSRGRVMFICNYYAGVWLEHAFDGVAWARIFPEDAEIAKNQVCLFLDNQHDDGQLPFNVTADSIGYTHIQECVSFGKICMEAAELNNDDKLIAYAYEKLCKWDEWQVKNRIHNDYGLIEMYCGYDTGHDNSGRLDGMKYPEFGPDNGERPTDCDVLPVIAPDMNAVFYGDRMALAAMAEKLGKTDEAAEWRKKAEQTRQAIMDVCYDPEDMFFYDVDKNGKQRKIKSIQITNVLCEDVCDYDLANKIFEKHFLNPDEFGTPFPYPSVAANDPVFRQTQPANTWGYFCQGLTMLRSTRWMERYGRGKEMEENMRKWLACWCRSTTTQMGQELDPFTGEPAPTVDYYSSTMIFLITAAKHLGII